MHTTMEKPTVSSRRSEELNFHLREELLKGCISGERTSSRRLSASELTSYREAAGSFRDTPTFSSTASSPRYPSRGITFLTSTPRHMEYCHSDYVDPSMYKFTAALKGLQTRSRRDSLQTNIGSPLHSKWNDAERYICNPHSGEVPVECLSAKALSRIALINTTRMAKSGPLVFSHSRGEQATSTITHEQEPSLTEMESCQKQRPLTRDVGTQSTPPDLNSSSSSSDSAPHIKEISQISCGIEGEKLSYQVLTKPQQNEVEGREKQKDGRKQEGEGKKMFKFKCKVRACLSWVRGSESSREQRKRRTDKSKKKSSDLGKGIERFCNCNVCLSFPERVKKL